MPKECKFKEYEAFFLVSEQLKYWMHQDVTVQEAMEALEIKPNRMYGIGWHKADWFDLGLVMVKEWKYKYDGKE